MKWAVPELRRLNRVTYNDTLELNDDIVGFNGCKSISAVSISGDGKVIDKDKFEFRFNIKASMVLTCAVSLLDVNYDIDLNCEEIFAFDNSDNDDYNIIDGQTIDLKDVVITNIIINIPMKIVKEGYENLNDNDENVEKINPAFASLADYKFNGGEQ